MAVLSYTIESNQIYKLLRALVLGRDGRVGRIWRSRKRRREREEGLGGLDMLERGRERERRMEGRGAKDREREREMEGWMGWKERDGGEGRMTIERERGMLS